MIALTGIGYTHVILLGVIISMNIQLGKYFLVLAMLSLLPACAQFGQQEAQSNGGKNAITYSDHEKLANYYADQAKEMAVKAEEKKKALSHYENRSNRYGRRGQDFASHARANVRYYEQAANEAVKQAGFHQKIAADLRKRESAVNVKMPNQQNQQKIKTRMDSGSSNKL